MNAVKVWGLSICVAVIIGALVSMIMPSLEKNKVFKLILSAFILVSAISPVSSIVDSISVRFETSYEKQNLSQNEIVYDKMIDSLENSSCEVLYPLIKDYMKDYGFEDEFGVSVVLRRKESGIEVERVNIIVSGEHKIDKAFIEERLSEKLGLNIELCSF